MLSWNSGMKTGSFTSTQGSAVGNKWIHMSLTLASLGQVYDADNSLVQWHLCNSVVWENSFKMHWHRFKRNSLQGTKALLMGPVGSSLGLKIQNVEIWLHQSVTAPINSLLHSKIWCNSKWGEQMYHNMLPVHSQSLTGPLPLFILIWKAID